MCVCDIGCVPLCSLGIVLGPFCCFTVKVPFDKRLGYVILLVLEFIFANIMFLHYERSL